MAPDALVTTAAPTAATFGARVVGTVATGIETPWGIAFLPGNGGAFVGSRDTANIYLVRPGQPNRVVGHISGVVSNGRQGGEAGLLGFALSPRFAVDHQLYIYLSTLRDNRIVRMTYAGGRLTSLHTVLKGIPRGLHHNGGGLGFGPDGMLYASTGESGVKSLAQNLHSLGGKILRLTPAGRVPANNPFRGSYVYSYGHRNVEGFAWDAGKRLWAVEFGDKAYDELNLILPGHNYGWPATQGFTKNPRYTSPKLVWRTDVAGPSSIAIVRGVAWISALTGHRLYRVPLIGTRAGTPHQYLVGTYGRIRKVALAPNGLLWVTTSNTDGRAVPRRGDDRILAVKIS
jgi:glucose/arabinose dehydrogenase